MNCGYPQQTNNLTLKNMELLKKLYLIDAKSGAEKKQRDFIVKYVKDIKDVTVDTDKAGNLLIKKGTSDTYPCIVAHMDEVHTKRDKDFTLVESNGFIMGMNVGKRERHGIGADDKNGIWVALKCLEKYDAIKCAFFVSEETGCIGSSKVNMSFFNDCRFVLECDRRNNGDFIDYISGELCSNDFVKDANIKDYGYKRSNGLTTDVGELKTRGLKVSCCNMSCGCYEPHTASEYTYFPDLEKCLKFAQHIIEDCTKVYPHERKKAYYNSFEDDGGWFGRSSTCGYETYKQKTIRIIKEWLEETEDLDMLSAWINARAELKCTFDEFTDAWTEYQLEINADLLQEQTAV